MQRDKQAQILADIAEFKAGLAPTVKSGPSYVDIILALQQFSECVRYLNTRRSSGSKLELKGEAEVQDLIYLMLRPWILDLVPETPTEKVANRYTIKDFFSRSAKSVVEAKFIRNESHGKNISKELHDDIENYRHNPDCEHLIFFIYDPDSNIPDVGALKRSIEVERRYGDRQLHCFLIVP